MQPQSASDPSIPGFTLVLMAGLPGSGKSALARELGRSLGWPVIDKDILVSSVLASGIPEPKAQPASYDLMFALADDLLRAQGQSVICDSPAGFARTVENARRITIAAGARLVCILCLAERDTRNNRVATRRSLRSQPLGVSSTIGTGRHRFTHLPADTIEADMDEPLSTATARTLRALRERFGIG